ncbi:MAG: hypothetical protein ACOZAA_02830 [Pseudomonadota bacterium]
MNLDEYAREKQALYADFARAVAVIVDSALADLDRPLLRYMRHRAKTVVSLRNKLAARDWLKSSDIEDRIVDLAGCRVILFDDADIDFLRSSHVITECFDVDWDLSKIHHGDVETADVNDLYRGVHYVVRLKEGRASLPEYRRFAGLRCEIQLQTILTHAWSETAHDIIYKPLPTDRFGSELMSDIKKRMRHIMAKHIVPAGHAFSKVRRDFDRLSRGLEIVDRGGLNGLANCHDNNERYELIQNYADFVLPHLETAREEHADIVAALLGAADAARTDTAPELDTPFGAYRGHDADAIVGQAASIISTLRYIDVGLTFAAYCRLYDLAEGDAAKKQIVGAVKTFSAHHITVWERAGPAVQTDLVAAISSWNAPTRTRYREIALTVAEETLGSEAERTSETSATMTLHRGSVIPCDELAAVRAKAIACVIGYYSRAESEEERRRLINILLHGTYEPDHSSDSLRAILVRDAADIVVFLRDAALEADFSFRQHIEHQVHYVHRRLNRVGDEVCAALGESIRAFRAALDADEDFQVYRVLVGFESVFPPAWEDPSFEWEAEERYRTEAHAPLIESITPETYDVWRSRLSRCASTKSRDLATFPPFHEFLKRLGAERPEFAAALLGEPENAVVNFAATLLEGVEASGRADLVETVTDDWLQAGRSLWAIVVRAQEREVLDLDLLARATERAIEVGDDWTLHLAMGAAAKRIKDGKRPLIDRVFWPAFSYFHEKGEWRWSRVVSLRLQGREFFAHFSPEEVAEILENLVAAPEVDHRLEAMLAPLAATFGVQIVQYFGKRVARETVLSGDSAYEPMPYRLYKIPAALSAPASEVVDMTFEWRGPDGERALEQVARFIKQCYGDLPLALADKLRSFVEEDPGEKRSLALLILRRFEGSEAVLPVVKSLARLIEVSPDIEGDFFIILMPSGISSGQYGYRDRLVARLKDIEPWTTDDSPVVAAFASRTCKTLARDIAAETRHVEQMIAQREADYDEDLSDEGG